MRGWIALIVLYGLLVIAGGAVIIARRGPTERDWLAARRLLTNHRVSAPDLRAPEEANALGIHLPEAVELHGRFVVDEIPEGKAVTRKNLRGDPVGASADGKAIFWIPFTDAPPAAPAASGSASPIQPSARAPEVGAFVDVCVPTKGCMRGEVVKMYCPEPPTGQKSVCTVGLRLPDSKETQEALTDKTKVLIEVSPSQQKETR